MILHTMKLFRRMPASLTALAAVAAVVLAVAPAAAASQPAPDKATAKFEVRFLTGMIDHHAMAIEMAEACLENAEHPELEAMCEQIIAAQSQEIETMQSWLADWYGIAYAPEMKPGEMRMIEKLASLSGADFEISFMEMMIRHHRMAIMEAERCLDRAGHGELRAMCGDIVAAQTAEIEQLQAWLCEWYGRCRDQ